MKENIIKKCIYLLLIAALIAPVKGNVLANDVSDSTRNKSLYGQSSTPPGYSTWVTERKGKILHWMEGFTDLRGHWFLPTIHALYEIMDGVTKTEFAPDAHMTRAMMVKTLHNYRCNWELMDKPKELASNRAPFKDVKPGAWYAEAVDWAYENGIIKGIGDDMFAPDAFVTREEIAVMLRDYCEAVKSYYPISIPADRFYSFSDCSQVSPWAKDAMIWATYNRIIEGTPAKLLEPGKLATRAEAGRMIYTYMVKGMMR